MNSKMIFTASFAAAVAAMPVESEARADMKGLEACASAMTEHLAETQGAPVEYRLENGLADAGQRSSAGTWYLDARHPETREVVARIDCRVDARAQVTYLKQVPLTAYDARERAGAR